MSNLYFDLVQDGYQFSISIQSVVKCAEIAVVNNYFPKFPDGFVNEVTSMYEEDENPREAKHTGKIVRENTEDSYTLKFVFAYADVRPNVDLHAIVECLKHANNNGMLPKGYNLSKWLGLVEGVYRI